MSLSTDGLLCYYTFNSNQYNVPLQSGTSILNLANYQYDLIYTGTAGVVSVSGTQKKYGDGSLYNNLNSIGNYYKCSSCSSMNIANGFTFGCWLYFQSGSNGLLFLIGDNTSNIALSAGVGIGIAGYGTAAGFNISYNNPGSYGWHHILITASYSNPTTTIRIYVDGSPTTSIFGAGGNPFGGSGGLFPNNSTVTYNSQILTGDKSMYLLGYKSTIASIPSYIDEVFLFNRILSASEITAIYNLTYTSYIPTPPPPPYPCFLEGSKILRYDPVSDKESYVPVETLRRGDLIVTAESGAKPIHSIGYKPIPLPKSDSNPSNRLYKFSRKYCPDVFEPLYITGEHCTLHHQVSQDLLSKIAEHMGDVYVTENHYRVPAQMDDRAEPYDGEDEPVTIWHFALENENVAHNYGVWANGLLVESCAIESLLEKSGMRLLE